MIDPFRLTFGVPASRGFKKSGFAGSAGVGASEDSLEADGVSSKPGRRGRGRRIGRSSDMVSWLIIGDDIILGLNMPWVSAVDQSARCRM